MKILCVIDSLGSGGAQRQLIELALGFKNSYGFDVSFLIYYEDLFYKDILDENGISVKIISETNYFKRLCKMRNYIRNGNFDNVISFLEASSFICEISGLPFRKWGLIVGERSANPAIYKSMKLRLYRYFHFFADYVVANSKENIDMVKKINPYLSSSKLKVIYNIVDLQRWKPNYASDSRFLDRRFRLLVIASLRKLKNLKGLVEGIRLLGEKSKNIIIDWYGDSIKEPYIDSSFPEDLELIRKYKLNDVFNFYQATLSINEKVKDYDAIGLFSLYEGLPNAVCEGMASGKTVISSQVSDVSYFINDDNLLFNPNNPNEIALTLEYLLNLQKENLEKIGIRNRQTAEKLFSREEILESYCSLMKMV